MSDSSEYVNKSVAKISHNIYKDVLFNTKTSMNRIQNKNHRIGTYEINKISLSCFNGKIYSLDNSTDGPALEA